MEISTCLSINRASGTGGVGIAPPIFGRGQSRNLMHIIIAPNLPPCLQVYLRTYVLHIYRIFEGTFKVLTLERPILNVL